MTLNEFTFLKNCMQKCESYAKASYDAIAKKILIELKSHSVYCGASFGGQQGAHYANKQTNLV